MCTSKSGWFFKIFILWFFLISLLVVGFFCWCISCGRTFWAPLYCISHDILAFCCWCIDFFLDTLSLGDGAKTKALVFSRWQHDSLWIWTQNSRICSLRIFDWHIISLQTVWWTSAVQVLVWNKSCSPLLSHRDAVCIFYLVLRALDTVEDDVTIPADVKSTMLCNFHTYLLDPDWKYLYSTEKDRIVLEDFPVVCCHLFAEIISIE